MDVDDKPRAPSIWRSRPFVVSLVIALVVALGFGLVVPVLPQFGRSFGVSLFAVTGLVSAFAGVRLVSNLYTGSLTDRIGTRRAIGWGAMVVAVSSLLAAAAPGYWWLLGLRALGGFGSALFFNALLAHIIRIVPAHQRGQSIGMLQGSFLAGIALGPTVGGFLAAPLGLRWPFAIYGGFCAAAGLVGFFGLPKADDPTDEPASQRRATGLRALWDSVRTFCSDPTFVAAMLLMASSRWAATGVRFSLVPVFATEVVGTGQILLGAGLTLTALTHMAALWPAGRIVDTVGRKALAAPAYFLFAAVTGALAWATTPVLFLVALGLYGLGTGLTSVTPPAVVADITPPEETGRAVGLLNTAADLGSVLGPLMSGWLADAAGYGWGFGASAVLLAASGTVALFMRETLPAPSGKPS